MTDTQHRRLAACAVVAGLVCGSATAMAAPASAAAGNRATAFTASAASTGGWLDRITRARELAFAETHWNWTAWNDPTPVADGADQPNYQCAEFVARSLAAAGLIPGLSPSAPQSDYFNYTAPNGKLYDLLLISVLPQYHNIYDYLMDSGIGEDVGDDPGAARPGDFVVTYLGPNNTSSHMGLIATAPAGAAEATVDAHNHARHHYGYHYYAPSHLVELVPDALLKIDAWANEHNYRNPIGTPPLHSVPASPTAPHSLVGGNVNPYSDPAGPQV